MDLHAAIAIVAHMHMVITVMVMSAVGGMSMILCMRVEEGLGGGISWFSPLPFNLSDRKGEGR